MHAHAATAAADDGVCPAKAALAVQLVETLAPPKITKTDEAFAADGVEFMYSHEGIDLEELNDLFGKVRCNVAAMLSVVCTSRLLLPSTCRAAAS